jgi:hypothetical protein
MADIKAKDIAVAQSIASSDLILGSSIAGTTANVKVDTLGKYIVDTLPFASIGNVSVSTQINNIKSKQVTTKDTYSVLGKNMYVYKYGNFVHIESPYDMKMEINERIEYTIITLPTKYRPPLRVYGDFRNLFTSNDKYIRIEPTGDMIFYSRTAISGDIHNCAFSFSYLVE